MSASPAPSSSRKRSRTSLALDSEDDYEDQDAAPISQPASRKRKAASASSAVAAGPTANKKTDRMERNRLAAQASRDRRKAYTEELEAKVALLESQIASGSTLPRAASAAPSPASGRLATLEEENESLRQQLELSRSENVQVQLRMKDFESKLEWLSQLMSNQSQQQSSVSSTSVSPHDLQQHPSLSPISSTLSLDPQAVLSLLPVSPKQSTSSALSASPALIQQEQSLDGQQVESLVAREPQEFLPRISTCSPLQTHSRLDHCFQRQIAPQRQRSCNSQAKTRWRPWPDNSLSNSQMTQCLIPRRGISRLNHSKSMMQASGSRMDAILRRKSFLVLRSLSEKKDE